MSTQKGNSKRARPQKYQNNHAFKNDLHDKSHKTKLINNIQVVNVCKRCKEIIEWKIKYKKYKPLKAPSKCTKCEQKVVKHAYHIMCGPCALNHQVCPKCGEKGDIVREPPKEEPITLDRELRLMVKKLPERKRRTFMRYVNRKGAGKETEKESEDAESTPNPDDPTTKSTKPERDESSDSDDESQGPPTRLTRNDLLEKLKSLMINKRRNSENEFDSDLDDFSCDTDDEDDD